MALLLLAPLALLAAPASASPSGLPPWQNVTTYRLTPINYTGLTNMDSGNAAGDAMFGLSQMLLPQLCLVDPGMLWCGNRRYLSDGSAWMVYTEFVVQTRALFGDYSACNPNATTGIFSCMHWGPKGTPPPQCLAAPEQQLYSEDCLNGTVYRTVDATVTASTAAAGTAATAATPAATTNSSSEAEGACCAACAADNKAEPGKCRGWRLLAAGSEGGGAAGPSCELMAAPLVQFDGGISPAKVCAAAAEVVDYNSTQSCWWEDPATKASFGPYCSYDACQCDAIENLSMGREERAMCWHHHSSNYSS